jgi:hypothetical protein
VVGVLKAIWRASPASGKATQIQTGSFHGGARRGGCVVRVHLSGWRDLKVQTGLYSSDRSALGFPGTFEEHERRRAEYELELGYEHEADSDRECRIPWRFQ